jgi:SAM-dependent methyltransferase
MKHAGIDPDAFNAFEAAGWEQRAQDYDRFFHPLTSRLVAPLLDAASVVAGTRVLDIATGPGYVAGEAAARGAEVVGADVAEAMVALARRLHPDIDFRQADAHALPFEIRPSTPSSATSPSSTWDALNRQPRSSCGSSFRVAGSR